MKHFRKMGEAEWAWLTVMWRVRESGVTSRCQVRVIPSARHAGQLALNGEFAPPGQSQLKPQKASTSLTR